PLSIVRPATPELYPLSLHDALPISPGPARSRKPTATEKDMIRLMLAVAAGGVIGTLLRFALSTWVSTHWPRHFHLATLAVNLLRSEERRVGNGGSARGWRAWHGERG